MTSCKCQGRNPELYRFHTQAVGYRSEVIFITVSVRTHGQYNLCITSVRWSMSDAMCVLQSETFLSIRLNSWVIHKLASYIWILKKIAFIFMALSCSLPRSWSYLQARVPTFLPTPCQSAKLLPIAKGTEALATTHQLPWQPAGIPLLADSMFL